MPARVRGASGRPEGSGRVVRTFRTGREGGHFHVPGGTLPPIGTPDPPVASLAQSARGPLTVPEPSSSRPASWCHGG